MKFKKLIEYKRYEKGNKLAIELCKSIETSFYCIFIYKDKKHKLIKMGEDYNLIKDYFKQIIRPF